MLTVSSPRAPRVGPLDSTTIVSAPAAAGDVQVTVSVVADIEASNEWVDVDLNGVVDPQDLAAVVTAWGPCPAGDPCVQPGVCSGGSAVCGDGVCDPGEDAVSCPADCGTGACGDGWCDVVGGETQGTCASDCSVPAGWLCTPGYYAADDGCDCDCGDWDPDCDIAGSTIYNCSAGQS